MFFSYDKSERYVYIHEDSALIALETYGFIIILHF